MFTKMEHFDCNNFYNAVVDRMLLMAGYKIVVSRLFLYMQLVNKDGMF